MNDSDPQLKRGDCVWMVNTIHNFKKASLLKGSAQVVAGIVFHANPREGDTHPYTVTLSGHTGQIDCRALSTTPVEPDDDAAAVKKLAVGMTESNGMHAFRHRMTVAGYRSVIVNDGDRSDQFDVVKARRACNALLGRVASDRPSPTTEDWFVAARVISKSQDEPGFSSIPVLDALITKDRSLPVATMAWDDAEAAFLNKRKEKVKSRPFWLVPPPEMRALKYVQVSKSEYDEADTCYSAQGFSFETPHGQKDSRGKIHNNKIAKIFHFDGQPYCITSTYSDGERLSCAGWLLVNALDSIASQIVRPDVEVWANRLSRNARRDQGQ